MTTSGNGFSDGRIIYIISWSERLLQKTGLALFVGRMGYTNVKIVTEGHFSALLAAGKVIS